MSKTTGFDNELSSSGINEDILSSFLRDDTNVTEGSEDISWFLVDGTNATEGSEDISSFLLKDINLPGNNQMIFESQQGQKRSFEHHTDTMENEKHSDLSNDVSSDDMPNLKRKFVELEAKLETLKAEWMPRPIDSKVIQHFNETTNISRNDKENTIFHQDRSPVDIMRILNMNKDQLKICNKKSSTATARSVIKFIFPHPDSNFGYSQVDKIIIDTIIQYTKFSNPNDDTSDAKIRRAISNYFSYLNYQRKIKGNHYM
ncbi:unnamed protein product [Rotaria sp. Silwood1]|nr:unnamed protein product [Rotaria sp. Silwood1]